MAACVTTYFETGRGLGARIAEHNAAMMAQQMQLRRRVRMPEYYFAKHFDNTRLVKASDPVRVREMRVFSGRRGRALLSHHDLRPAALLRHRKQLSRRERKADARPVARRKSPIAPERSRAHAARPHRPDGPPAWARRAAAWPGDLLRRAACIRRSCSCSGQFFSAPGAVVRAIGPTRNVGSHPSHPQPHSNT